MNIVDRTRVHSKEIENYVNEFDGMQRGRMAASSLKYQRQQLKLAREASSNKLMKLYLTRWEVERRIWAHLVKRTVGIHHGNLKLFEE